MTLGIIPDLGRNGQLAHHNAPMRGTLLPRIEFLHPTLLADCDLQTVLTTQSCFVRPAGMADTLHTFSNGSTARLGLSRAELAPLQTVIIDALMSSDNATCTRPIYSTVYLFLPCPHWY